MNNPRLKPTAVFEFHGSSMLRVTYPKISKSGAGNFFDRLRRSVDANGLALEVKHLNPLPKVNFCHPNGKKHWGKNIVRIDGIYFGAFAQTTHGRKLNGVILKSINQSDGVIFQSEYCLRLVEQYLGDKNAQANYFQRCPDKQCPTVITCKQSRRVCVYMCS